MKESAVPRVLGENVLARTKFVEFKERAYLNKFGEERRWSLVSRVGGRQAVMIIPYFGDKLVVTREFRVPVDGYCYSFPAGLIDPGETPEESARRELFEETGYTGKILGRFPPAVSSPGLSGESAVLVRMSIDSAAFPTPPVQHLEETESIACFRVPRAELRDFLIRAAREGDIVDSKLFCLDLL